MSVEESKAIVRRYFDEIWNQRKMNVADEIIADHFIARNAAGVTQRGREAFKQYRSAAPDVNIKIAELIAEEDKVAAYVTNEVTRDGEKRTVEEFIIFRITGGKIEDRWLVMARQLEA